MKKMHFYEENYQNTFENKIRGRILKTLAYVLCSLVRRWTRDDRYVVDKFFIHEKKTDTLLRLEFLGRWSDFKAEARKENSHE